MRVVGLANQTFCYLVIKTQVEDGVHHTRHRCAGARTYTYQQRILDVTKFGVHQLFDVLDSSCYFIVQDFLDFLLAHLVIFITATSGNCETGRNWNSDKVHLGKVSTLAAEFLSHFCVTFGFTIAKSIDSFLTHIIKFIQKLFSFSIIAKLLHF